MLSWRIPTAGDPNVLRLGLAQVALASIVAALIIFAALPRDWLAPALLGLIPLAVFMAYRRWRAFHQSLVGPANVRLDDHGLFWLDASGVEQSFPRSAVTKFHISRDPDTLRPVPALTLHLHGGFESQPIELYPPATSAAVRRLLTEDWHIAEQPSTGADSLSYDTALAIYSECHDDYQEWHFEGPRAELLHLFDTIQSVSREFAPPPAGAKPLNRIIRCTRREPHSLKIAVSTSPHLDEDIIALPPELLSDLSTRGSAAINDNPAATDTKIDLHVSPSSTWTFHFHAV
ncbi:MAG TPA: hypothetical protein VGI40_08075 [Pirellulaceae bacterium]|jgi:hypothetical protein